MKVSGTTSTVPLQWIRKDIEQRLGFRGAKFTRVRHDVTFFLAAFLTVSLYAAMIPLDGTSYVIDMFTQRGPTQHAVVLLTFWAMFILAFKRSKLKFQRRSLRYLVIPDRGDFTLSVTTADQVIPRMLEIVDDPAHFLLYNRILIAISNLRNLGRVGDVEEILRSRASQDESASETSYSLLQGLIWAIPVLGFIGTVLGLSAAIGQFGVLLQSAADLTDLRSGMQRVTAGLSTAFETTLVALVAALVIQLLLVMTKKSEEEFLDECSEYCTRHIVGRLRVLPAEQSLSESPWTSESPESPWTSGPPETQKTSGRVEASGRSGPPAGKSGNH
ncbi:MAG: MotA/TolQ/ExbB proton channel family protein [Planctomycetia bacterium]|nr:MotA/TolQ/ExbB proton channel family protein [Planctomycetia bacterium]